MVRHRRRCALDHLGHDAGDGEPRRPRQRRPAARRPHRGPHARAGARARHGLALTRPRAAQAPRLVAGARGGRGLRGRAPCEGPRLRGVDGAPDPADCAPARPPAVRRARRPGDDSPAGAGRRGLRAVPAAPDGVRLRQRRLLRAHRGGAAAGGGGPCVPGALAVAEADSGGGARGGRPRPCGGARPGARPRQPGVLRAASRQELLLLRQRPVVPRVSRRRRDGACRRRPDRRERRAPRADLGVPPRRACEGLARGDRRRVERRARRLRRRRFQVDLSRRRSSHQARRLHARRPRDPQGAPVGLPAREERLRGARAHRGRRRRAAARRAEGRLGGVAGQLARARLHDGDGRDVHLPGLRARRGDRPRRLHRRLPAARSLACERRLLTRVDAPTPRHAERLDGVSDHRDGRVGATARRDGAVAQLRRLRGLPAHRRDRDAVDARDALGAPQGRPPLPGRAPAQLQPQVLPALAPPLLLLRAVDGLPARRSRVPARGVAADAARPWVKSSSDLAAR